LPDGITLIRIQEEEINLRRFREAMSSSFRLSNKEVQYKQLRQTMTMRIEMLPTTIHPRVGLGEGFKCRMFIYFFELSY
jgi:hypothetical protein